MSGTCVQWRCHLTRAFRSRTHWRSWLIARFPQAGSALAIFGIKDPSADYRKMFHAQLKAAAPLRPAAAHTEAYVVSVSIKVDGTELLTGSAPLLGRRGGRSRVAAGCVKLEVSKTVDEELFHQYLDAPDDLCPDESFRLDLSVTRRSDLDTVHLLRNASLPSLHEEGRGKPGKRLPILKSSMFSRRVTGDACGTFEVEWRITAHLTHRNDHLWFQVDQWGLNGNDKMPFDDFLNYLLLVAPWPSRRCALSYS